MRERVRKLLPSPWLLAWAALLAALPLWSSAESLPASVRACSTLTDSTERLACYDREVASFPLPHAPPRAATGAAAPTSAATATGKAQLASPNSSAGTAPSYGSSTQGTLAAAPTAADVPKPSTPSSEASSASSEVKHISARVVSIDSSPNEMTLHLDNGQIWQQLQAVVGDLSLRAGDTVQIDKHFGSYWLTGPHVSGMKVRQKG